MRRRKAAYLPIVGLIACVLAPFAPAFAEDAVAVLEDGVAMQRRIPRGRALFTAKVEVPEGAVALSVAVCGTRDIDVYLKRGAPLQTELADNADAMSRGNGQRELVRVTKREDGQLEPGEWFVMVEHPRFAREAVDVEVVALVDRPSEPPAVLPGADFVGRLGGGEDVLSLRTFLPRRARSLVLDVEGAEDMSVRYTLTGPGDATRTGRGPKRIVVARTDSPTGQWTFELTAPEKAPRRPLRVRARWVYDSGGGTPSREPLLRRDEPLTVALGGEWHPVLRRVRIVVPQRTSGFEVVAKNDAGADVDLFVRRGQRLTLGDGDADYFSLAAGPTERLVVAGVRPLTPGAYYLEVVLVDGCGPVSVTLSLKLLPARSGRATWGDTDPPVLEPGTWVEGTVASGLPGVTWYDVRVPAETRSLHAMLLESTAPLDLLLVRWTDGSIMRRALTPRVDERLDLTFARPPESERRFVLGVMNRSPNEPEVDFRLALGLNEPPSPPSDLAWPPVLAMEGLTSQERVAAATVEVTVEGDAGGSGVCVSSRGLILTCRHVLETEDGGGTIQGKDILVAFPRRLDTPPVQGFFARVVADDAAKDLALLQITSDVFGRVVDDDNPLPWLDLGDDGALRLGGRLLVCGYPAEGSARSRTPVILTRGAVAGLERHRGVLRWIKTDAWIGMGHSGGAVVNENHRLIGIAAATLGPDNVLGLAIPVSTVPDSWRDRIAKQRPDTD